MLKNDDIVNLLHAAGDRLVQLLKRVPGIKVKLASVSTDGADSVHLIFELRGLPTKRTLEVGCVVKSNGQPRHMRDAYFALMQWAGSDERRVMVCIAPYLSRQSRDVIGQFAGNYLDFAGNARLAFDHVYIETESAEVPKPATRELKSLFMPKAALVLRAMLRCVGRQWKVSELAEETSVSFGQISNVLKALHDRELSERGAGGTFLSDPNKLIDAWIEAYRGVDGQVGQYHTTLHGKALEEALRRTLTANWRADGNAVLASFSAANWMAAYGRSSTTYLYVDPMGLQRVTEVLKLRRVTTGANVEITTPNDNGIFYDAVAPAPGVACTSPIQTYLDLRMTGERGREAADFFSEHIDLWQPVRA
ncbi:type IV toxin-antitoxin system AbiEi family antitoxin [Massilia sp. erpn]|uniref:type IV toxin-antitoxin system AbiEi family antitoxin n=1 Tax=Massilia sp. erpn TaxID=2738142 RepID=UPI0021030D42|nr:type IV toxin-antitoxin system AbiEi family antitoxin [Massilia sp. erpn]UTY57728.1 hypothetical protein HPQ68_11365 [Massilia sp. erpn]